MPFSTFDELRAAIARWAIRTGDAEFEAQIPDFIALCEARINRTLRIGAMERTAPLAVNGDGFADLPVDYLEYRSVDGGTLGYGEAEMVSPGSEIGSYDVSGTTQRFAIVGGRLRIYPAGAATVRLTYYARIPALSGATPMNWLLTASPDLYLYGSLLEAMPFMEDDSRAAVWKQYYDVAMGDLKAADIGARFAGGRSRVRGETP